MHIVNLRDICRSSQLSIASHRAHTPQVFDQEHSNIPQLIEHIKKWFETWSASSRLFEDAWAPETDQARKHIVAALRRDLDRVS